jgi:drug/metabolite transporter (DMT)-like permease
MSSSPRPNVPEKTQPDIVKVRLEDDKGNSDIIDYLHVPGKLKEDSTAKGTHELVHPDAFRSLTVSPFSEYGGRLSTFSVRTSTPVPISIGPQTWRDKQALSWASFWARNRGVVLVATAQLFGALMNLFARLLELDGEGMHPFQILFARMSLTTLFSIVYAYKTQVPFFPLGPKGVRWLLAVRGVTGFFGIYGMWYSMMYLPLAEATVITFLGPSVAGYICHVWLHEPFTRKEQLASYVALAGVVFIAKPTTLFHSGDAAPTAAVEMTANATSTAHHPQTTDEATPAQRLSAIGWALLGVIGGACAISSLRCIGKRAHPLISVNYFSVWCVIVSTTVLTLAPALDIGQPELHFALPASPKQWAFLVFLGACGFIMQVLFTAGVAAEKSNRATAMVYTHMLFAASFDRWVFGHEMGFLSVVGCGLIIGSALWVALTRRDGEKGREGDVEPGMMGQVEAVPMLREDSREDEDDGIPLERVG